MKIIITAFSISFLLLLIGLSIAYVKLIDINQLLVVHFDSYHGIDFLGSKWHVFAILLSGVGINLVNLFLSNVLRSREYLLALMVSAFSVFLSSLILIATLVIIANN